MTSLTSTTAVAGSAQYADGRSKIVKAGNVSGALFTSQTLRQNALKHRYRMRPFPPTSVAGSGNLGTYLAFSSGSFAYEPPTVTSSSAVPVVIQKVSTTLAGASTNVIKFTAADRGQRRAVQASTGDRVYNNTNATGATFDMFTGTLTKGTTRGTAGTRVQPSGLDNTVGSAADHSVSVDAGELVFMQGSTTPNQADYATRYNP